MLPISLEDQLVPGSLEHAINELVEKHINLSVFDARYNNDDSGASAIHPKVLLKIILFAYFRGMMSSRQMERACVENVTMMALACGYTPNHSTIAAFVSSMKMPTSHGVLQGYNAQALVDSKHQVILAAEAFASQDHENLPPMLDGDKKNLTTIGKVPDYFEGRELTADSNYHSLNSLTVCKNEKLDAYVPDIQFRKRDERFADQERFKDGDFGGRRRARRARR